MWGGREGVLNHLLKSLGPLQKFWPPSMRGRVKYGILGGGGIVGLEVNFLSLYRLTYQI